ncbi:hypothetical protein CEP54_003575 [Fusarium duplospermum]|uniref:Uncharacterized protein n=1 Tax=Fusarium duplospermum TaxID=1325734 RepID=A0A428QN86_9HYPO|nr:hypothetical protein CEP54_003575 [Fusarium duplospermum]
MGLVFFSLHSESPVTKESSEEYFRQLFRDWTTKKAPRPAPAAAAPDFTAKGVKAGVWTEDLSPNPKKRKAGGNEGRESEARKQARKKGATAVMTMAINKKAGLTVIWRDVTGSCPTTLALRNAQVECISKHDACERTAAEAHNRGLALHLGQRSLLQLAQLATQIWGQGSISTARSLLLTKLRSKGRLF